MAKTKPLKVQLYVLGMLARYGPQHGYNLKQRLSEQVADFARIELGNVYYHLKRMEGYGWVLAKSDREGKRPERSVFSITKSGEKALDDLLRQALDDGFWAEFAIDGVIFFADRFSSPTETLSKALQKQATTLTSVLETLRDHRQDVLKQLPPHAVPMASALFRHHEIHYEAELEWIREVLDTFGTHEPGRKRKK